MPSTPDLTALRRIARAENPAGQTRRVTVRTFEYEQLPALGTPVYLIRVEPEQGAGYWIVQPQPGRTNQSRAVLVQGWLGSTNNVSEYAHGRYLLSRVEDLGERRDGHYGGATRYYGVSRVTLIPLPDDPSDDQIQDIDPGQVV